MLKEHHCLFLTENKYAFLYLWMQNGIEIPYFTFFEILGDEGKTQNKPDPK